MILQLLLRKNDNRKRDNLAKFNAEKEAEKLKAASEPKPEIKKDQPEEK